MPLIATHLPDSSVSTYDQLAHRLYDSCCITDPWLDGRERFSLDSLVLMEHEYAEFCAAAEAIGALYDEMCELVNRHPAWLDEFFHLTPYQKLLWLASDGRWHGIARVDLFRMKDGKLQIAEMNSDTPSGEAEALVLNQLFHDPTTGYLDPNHHFPDRFHRMLIQSHRITANPSLRPTVGLVYPTEMPEDMSMIALYKNLLEERGCRVVLGSPYNISRGQLGHIRLLGTEIDILLRHYKTDWWTERLPVWRDELPYPDSQPLERQIQYVLDAELRGLVTVVNPFGAVLTQNKLSMAFFWKFIDQFCPASQNTIRSLVPYTVRLVDADADSFRKDEWVLKSDYGCEGDEVLIGDETGEETWNASLLSAFPHRWILQRRFEPERICDGLIPNFGVFLVGGTASEVYTRLSRGATNHAALTIPTFVQEKGH